MGTSVALVLSSGGARGLAQIGVMKELEKQGFRITSVAGTSIGSWIGGMYAMGQLDHFTESVCSLNRLEILSLMNFTLSTHGVLSVERAFRKMEREIPDVLIEDLKIPYVAMATDIINKKEVAFTEGSLYKAIRASIAIPAIITPVREHNRILVDGGVLNPLPIKQVYRNPGDILVAVNLYGTDEDEREKQKSLNRSTFNGTRCDMPDKTVMTAGIKMTSFSDGNKQTLNYISIFEEMVGLILQSNVDNALDMYKPDITIHIPKNSAKAFDFHKAEELIEKGRIEARKSIVQYNNNRMILQMKREAGSSVIVL
jgi:NTE family protein